MTTIYKEVLIESVEQAESLPIGSIVLRTPRLPKKQKDGTWRDLYGECVTFDIIDWEAIVPINVTLRGSNPSYGILEKGGVLRIPEPGEEGTWYQWTQGWVEV